MHSSGLLTIHGLTHTILYLLLLLLLRFWRICWSWSNWLLCCWTRKIANSRHWVFMIVMFTLWKQNPKWWRSTIIYIFIPARTYVNHSWYMRDLCVIHSYIYVDNTCYVCQHRPFTRYISDPSVTFTQRLRVLSAMHTWSIRGTVKSGVCSAYKHVNFTNVPRVLREWKTHDSRITRELHVFFTRFRSFEQLKTWESRKKALHA